jgi:hypothetical protein
MGASTIFDIVSSTVVGSLLLLIALRLNAQAVETNAIYQNNLKIQQDLVVLTDVLEYDFRKIGYCKDFTKIQPPNIAIIAADSTSIKFMTDCPKVGILFSVLDLFDSTKGIESQDLGDGKVDTIYYCLGDTSELASTPNPRDRYLYRIVNGNKGKGWNLGVTQFSLKYYDALGDSIPFPVPDPRLIYTMEINISLESPAPLLKTEYTSAAADSADYKVYWRQIRLASRNLRNR